tara:strand:+ start:3431 stop:4438 length:1008 start_codon:yes stop_codon:yes gene_type:complete
MKLLSVIGTRPQYIKIKPFYDFCKRQNIDHQILDTLQHYSDNVSKDLIGDLDLRIDFTLKTRKDSELSFIAGALEEIGQILQRESPDYVLVYGDTNSTLCASLAAYKLNIPVAHVEAGLRCGDIRVPEEVNRIFADTVAAIQLCSSKAGMKNLQRGIYCGDLEYEILNTINPSVVHGDFGVMTIHRQSNTTPEQLHKILDFCSQIPHHIRFYVHHRTLPFLRYVDLPTNIEVYESCPYSEMVKNLAECKFILTDSGGIQKTAPFFGKKTLVFRSKIEWTETEEAGYVKKADYSKESLNWLLSGNTRRSPAFYGSTTNTTSEIIYNSIAQDLEGRA